MHVGWLRNRGTTPSSPLGSPARSVCSGCAKRARLSALSCREERMERVTQKELEGVWATLQPIWDALHRQSVPEVTDKADPIFVECLKVPHKKMSFGRKKKKQADCSRALIRAKVHQKQGYRRTEILMSPLLEAIFMAPCQLGWGCDTTRWVALHKQPKKQKNWTATLLPLRPNKLNALFYPPPSRLSFCACRMLTSVPGGGAMHAR